MLSAFDAFCRVILVLTVVVQILRSDYMAQRRKWEEERDREALSIFEDYDAEYELPSESDVRGQSWPMTPRLKPRPDDEQQVDEIAQMEEAELCALLDLQDHQEAEAQEAAMQMQTQMQDIPSSPTRYGSDDDDFDEIFMELASSQPQRMHMSFEGPLSQQQEDTDMMDTT
jgi:hypothetical protein